MGIEPDRHVYEIAANRVNDDELTGPCFSPDGQTLFLSIQEAGISFAIWGPFATPDAGRERRMAAAASPGDFGPSVGAEGAEFALRHGISRLEAAAFQRLFGPPF